MTHRGLMLCMAVAIVASASLVTHQRMNHRKLWRLRKAGGRVPKPPMDVSLTSSTVPL